MNLLINPFVENSNNFNQAILSAKVASRLFSPITLEGGCLGVYGERGMGKSLILNYISNPPIEWQKDYFHNHIFVLLNCQDAIVPQSIDNFWFQVTKQLKRKSLDDSIKRTCQALLQRFEEGRGLNHNDFHEVLDAANEAKKRIVLTLDDFDCLIRTDEENLDDTRTFLQGFRSLTTRDSNKANLVVATRYSLQELCRSLSAPYYSAFENGFTNYRLRGFGENELLMLLQRAEQAKQLPFSPAEARYIKYLSGFHPRLVQIAAAEIFDQRIESGAPLNQEVLENTVGERFKSETRIVFEGLWQGASEIERLLLMLVALQKSQGRLLNVQYDLGDLFEVFSGRERELVELTERGLLNRTLVKPPTWEIFSPIFQWWILKEIESGNTEQISERRRIWGNLITKRRADKLSETVEFLRKNKGAIEVLGRSILRITGWEAPQLPGV